MAPPDRQKKALYAWEESWRSWSRDDLTLAECRAVIRTACAKFDVKPPRVKQRPYKRGLSWSQDGVICMQGGSVRGWGGKNIPTCLHEAAHHIVDHKFDGRGPAPQDHGPLFLGVFIWLLATARVAPTSALLASARKKGLQWRSMASLARYARYGKLRAPRRSKRSQGRGRRS